jgi:predicted transcriptional regulator
MPTLSVKLPEETKQRLQWVAQKQGTTVHAVMVDPVMAALAEAEHRQSLVAAGKRHGGCSPKRRQTTLNGS